MRRGSILRRIVIGDETWMLHLDTWGEKSINVMETHLISHKKFKIILPVKTVMATIFGNQDVLLINFLTRGSTVDATSCATLGSCERQFGGNDRNCSWEMSSYCTTMHLFGTSKKHLSCPHFQTHAEVQDVVINWLSEQGLIFSTLLSIKWFTDGTNTSMPMGTMLKKNLYLLPFYVSLRFRE